MVKQPGKTRRFPIPPGQRHRSKKDYRRQPKHKNKEHA